MASKFALFYRFSDYYKRKDVIEQFPVFAWIALIFLILDIFILDSKNALLKKINFFSK